jgi:hypothetical protein
MNRCRARGWIALALLAVLFLLTVGSAHAVGHGDDDLSERCATCKAMKVSRGSLTPAASIPPPAPAVSEQSPERPRELILVERSRVRSRGPPSSAL